MSNKSIILNRLIHGGVWASIGKILFTLSTLAWNALLTRLLSESEVGSFYIIASIVVVGEIVVLGGMNRVVMRLISASDVDNHTIRKIIRGSLAIVITLSLISCFIYLFLLGPFLGSTVFHSTLISELTVYTTAWFTLKALQTFLAHVLRGFHRISIAAFVDGTFTSLFITLALSITWIFSKNAEINDILWIVIGALTVTVSFTVFLIRESYSRTPPVSGFLLSQPIRMGIPFSILAFTTFGIRETHVWIAGAFVDHTDVAIFGAASRLANFLQIPLLIINGVIASSISQLYSKNDYTRIQTILQTTAIIAALPTIFTAVIFALGSHQILTLLFGYSYSAGSTVLYVLVIGHLINALSGSPGVLLAMSDKQSILMIIGIASGLVGLFFSLSLVNIYGIFGVAIGATLGVAIQNFSMWLYCFKFLHIKTHASIFSLRHVKIIFSKKSVM